MVARFLSAIDLELSLLDRPKLKTLFLGGGTPTHLDASEFNRLVEILEQRFDLSELEEFSTEANPEDIDDEKLDAACHAGINRMSLGVQSFHSKTLSVLQRGHSPEQACETVRKVAERIPNVSIDLIFASPGQDIEDWKSDLSTALSLPIQHLSTYALTFEKGTTFWNQRNRGALAQTGEDAELEMFELARSMTRDRGLRHYEISNFARDGLRCQHNMAYWRGAGWYAAGPGAARFVDMRREVNHRSTTAYLKRIESGQNPTVESEQITAEQAARERVAFGIRLIEGIDLGKLSVETGLNILSLLSHAIAKCSDDGLIIRRDDHIRLSERGIQFADTVASRIL